MLVTAALANLLHAGSPLHTMEVSFCADIPQRATARLARALKTNSRLETLIYTGNGVTKQGAQAFAGGWEGVGGTRGSSSKGFRSVNK